MKKKTYKKYMNEIARSIIISCDSYDNNETWIAMPSNQKGIRGRRLKKIMNKRVIHDAVNYGFSEIPTHNYRTQVDNPYNEIMWISYINPYKKYCLFIRENPLESLITNTTSMPRYEIRRIDNFPHEKIVHVEKYTNNIGFKKV